MKDLLIIAINGSPNKKGNTACLLQEALGQCQEMGAKGQIIDCQTVLKEQKTPFCVACSSPCSGKCYKDTSLEKAYALMAQADALIVGSPVYFGSPSAQLKAFWDKGRQLRSEKKLINVVGGAVTSGRSRFGGQEPTLRTIHDMLLVQGMIVVGDGRIAEPR
jgi:multimeric flavodoxin WrbA